MPLGSRVRACVLICLPLVLSQISAAVAPFGPISAILIPFIVIAFPGMLWISPPRAMDWGYWASVGGVSAAILVAGVTAGRVMGIHLLPVHGWAFLWLVLIAAWGVRRDALLGLPDRVVGAIAGMARWRKVLIVTTWCVACISSRWVVPPQQDQDMVIANPTYGYLQHGKPYGTETHFAYIFSKPPLLHLQAGFTLLLIDRLEQANFYWQSGRIVELLGEPPWATRRFRQKDIEAFELHPELIAGTRLMTTFYALLAPLLVADLARLLGAGVATAFLGGLAFLTIPEVVIRMGYAGFTMPSTVLLALSALLVLGPAPPRSRWAVGSLTALLNQKMLFVPAVYAIWRGLMSKRNAVRRVLTDPWLLGVAFGTVLWWSYGALIDWSTFLKDHVYYDFRDRFLFQDLSLGARGPGWYPGIGGLWLEWARNLSPPLLALGVAGVVWGLTASPTTRFLSLWALAGWVLGSATDWRQTKHLMLTIVPMAVAAQLLVERLHPRLRLIAGLVCGATILWNVVRIVNVWIDFDSLSPSTVW